MKTPDWIAAVTALVTLAGVVVVYLQLRALSQQIKLQHFSDYTKRYQEIALHFPEDINVSNFVLAGRDDYNQTMRYMRAYFDLSYEEWDLSQKKLIDPAFWGHGRAESNLHSQSRLSSKDGKSSGEIRDTVQRSKISWIGVLIAPRRKAIARGSQKYGSLTP